MAINLSYLTLKAASESRDHEEKQQNLRHRNLMVLIIHYLKGHALFDSADTLLRESKALNHDISGYTVCDNMDLSTILLEYECGYFSRLQKKPKFIRELVQEEKPQQPSPRVKRSMLPCKTVQRICVDGSNSKISKSQESVKNTLLPEIISTKLGPRFDDGDSRNRTENIPVGMPVSRLQLALQTFENRSSGELQELAQVISKEMYIDDPNVHWDDIKGMDGAKSFVKEAVVYPVKYPELFQGILSPWRGLLLAGPPGTGKTMLAKAVATECKTAFFNITASTVVSKWRGESEKLIRVLFDLARKCAPSTIFLDELDSLMGQRGEAGEHEGSRRMKTEILIQMDGLQKSNDLVFVLAASNLPWELDSAIIRRLEKRVFVDLPDQNARRAMFLAFLPKVFHDHPLEIRTELDYQKLAELTTGYSGSDIYLICKEAAMRAIRKIFDILNDDTVEKSSLFTLKIQSIQTEDVVQVLTYTKPADSTRSREKYEKWKEQLSAS